MTDQAQPVGDMGELVERLRSLYVMFAGKPHFSNKLKVHKAADLHQAADAIEQLQSNVERLTRALEQAHSDARLAANALGNSSAEFRSVEEAFRIIERRTGEALSNTTQRASSNDAR